MIPYQLTPELAIALIFLILWDLIWRGIALWKAGRSNELGWFVCILLLNTAGILPILYVRIFQKNLKKNSRKK